MKAEFQILEPDEVEVKMTFVMTLREWRMIKKGMVTSRDSTAKWTITSSRFRQFLIDAISKAEETYQVEESNES